MYCVVVLLLVWCAAAEWGPPGPVQVFPCGKSPLQQWDYVSDRSIHIRGTPTLCLDVGPDSLLWVNKCNSSSTQQQWVLDTNHQKTLRNKAIDKCVHIAGCCDKGPVYLSTCVCDFNTTDCGWELTHDHQLITVLSHSCMDAGGMNFWDRSTLCSSPFSGLPFCNTSLSPMIRAKDMVARMSLSEKIQNLGMLMVPQINSTGPVNHNLRATGGAPSVGLPPLLFNEAMHGIACPCTPSGCPTMFPVQLTQTSSFNRTLWREVAKALGKEGRALYNSGYTAMSMWAPDVNPFRDPRYGRGQETGGEDSWLNGQVAIEYVKGLQGDDPKYLQLVSTCKHVFLYDSQTPSPISNDFNVTERDLHDYYLLPWEACVKEANVSSLMCSYGSFNHTPDCANPWMIEDLARGVWNFDGYVVSDCPAIQGDFRQHHDATTRHKAAAKSLNAGVDLDCGVFYVDFLPEAIQKGETNEHHIDTALVRVLTKQVQLGLLDPPDIVPYSKLSLNQVDTQDHRDLAKRASLDSMVLLKNKGGLLPLIVGHNPMKIAIVGPHGNSTIDLLGNDENKDNKIIQHQSVLQAAKRMSNTLDVRYAEGCSLGGSNTSGIKSAVEIASGADVAVVLIGLSPAFENEGHDRKTLILPGVQMKLVEAVRKVQPKTVVVLIHAGALGIDDIVKGSPQMPQGVDSILDAGYPGEYGGETIMETLLGINNPAGKLVVTAYSSKFDIERPKMDNQDLRGGVGITYRYYKGAEVLYPYGWGLSYTTFLYKIVGSRNREVSIQDLVKWGRLLGGDIVVKVVNTGKRDGDAVVLAFISGPTRLECPLKSLFDFARVSVKPSSSGEGGTLVNFLGPLTRFFSCVRDNGERWIYPGSYTLLVGDVVSPVLYLVDLTGVPTHIPTW